MKKTYISIIPKWVPLSAEFIIREKYELNSA